MPKAIWNGAVLAESDRTEVVEGNQYFPPDSIKREYLKESQAHTTCPWKGVASYYSIEKGFINKTLSSLESSSTTIVPKATQH